MEKKILKNNNSVKLSKKDDFAELSDVLKTSEVKKMMRIFSNGDDDFVQKNRSCRGENCRKNVQWQDCGGGKGVYF